MRDLDQRGERGRDRERERESESTKGKELTSSKAGLLTLDLLGDFSPLLLVDTRRLGKSVADQRFCESALRGKLDGCLLLLLFASLFFLALCPAAATAPKWLSNCKKG